MLSFLVDKQQNKLEDLRQNVTNFEKEVMKIRESIVLSSHNSSVVDNKESVSKQLVNQTEALESRIKRLRQYYIKCNASEAKSNIGHTKSPVNEDMQMSSEVLKSYIEKGSIDSPDVRMSKGFKNDVNHAMKSRASKVIFNSSHDISHFTVSRNLAMEKKKS